MADNTISELTPKQIVEDLSAATSLYGDMNKTDEPGFKGKTNDDVAKHFLNKYGLNNKEAKDLVWANTIVEHPEAHEYDVKKAVDIRNRVFSKIMNEVKGVKVKEYDGPLIPKGDPVTPWQSFIGSLIPQDDIPKYLRGQGYQAERDPNTNVLMFKRKNAVQWQPFKPSDLDIMNVVDLTPDYENILPSEILAKNPLAAYPAEPPTNMEQASRMGKNLKNRGAGLIPDIIEGAITTAATATKPVWAIPTQAALGAGSELIRQFVSQQVGGRGGPKDPTNKEREWDWGQVGTKAALSGGLGILTELGGAIAKRVPPALQEISRYKEEMRRAAPKMLEAAKKLGFTFTDEELARSPAQRKLFDAISRAEPSVGGYLTGEFAIQREYRNRMDKLDDLAEAIMDEASKNVGAPSKEALKNASMDRITWEAGDKVRKGVGDIIQSKKDASSFFYKRVDKVLGGKDWVADMGSFDNALAGLRKDFRGSETADKIIDNLEAYVKKDTRGLKDIANIRSDMLSKARQADMAGDSASEAIHNRLADIMKDIEDKTYEGLIKKYETGAKMEFLQNAENAKGVPSKFVEKTASVLFPPNKNINRIEVANMMRKDQESARRLWREANVDAEKYLMETGKKSNKDLASKIDQITTEKAENSLEKMVPKGDYEKMQLMKQTYPNIFKEAQRNSKAPEVQKILKEVAIRQERGKVDWSTTLEKLSRLRNEDLSIILGRDSRQKVDALKTVYKYAPELINASGTKINANIIDAAILYDTSTAFKRWLLKQTYKVANADKIAKALGMYTPPVKQVSKGLGQVGISSGGGE